jgi:hypothetical protein
VQRCTSEHPRQQANVKQTNWLYLNLLTINRILQLQSNRPGEPFDLVSGTRIQRIVLDRDETQNVERVNSIVTDESHQRI